MAINQINLADSAAVLPPPLFHDIDTPTESVIFQSITSFESQRKYDDVSQESLGDECGGMVEVEEGWAVMELLDEEEWVKMMNYWRFCYITARKPSTRATGCCRRCRRHEQSASASDIPSIFTIELDCHNADLVAVQPVMSLVRKAMKVALDENSTQAN